MNNSEAESDKKSNCAGASRFATTHWTVVLTAGKPESSRYRQALETLCQTYWFPLYAYLRRQGHDAHQAEDYVQAFFAKLLEKHGLRLADPKRGRFRSFLLAALKHFLANEVDRVQTQKRGGNLKIFSLNNQDAETRYSLQHAHHLTPEKLFQRHWALTLLERTLTQLQAEAVHGGKQELFNRLKCYLTWEKDSSPYRDAAAELNMTEGAVKAAVHRLRVRYRQLLRDEIAQTVANEDQIDEEIHDLFTALAG